MRTLAQFAIRDLDPSAMGDAPADAGDANRVSTSSVRSSAILAAGASSLRNVENTPQIPEHEEYDPHRDNTSTMQSSMHDILADDQPTPTAFQHADPMEGAAGYGYDGRTDTGVSGYGYEGYEHQQDEPAMLSELDSTPIMGYDDGQSSSANRLPGADGRESFGIEREPDAEEWTADAIMHMNLASNMDNRRDSQE